MLKSMFHCTLALAVCGLMVMPAVAAKGDKKAAKHAAKADSGKQRVTIEVVGADSSQSEAITKALAGSGLNAKVFEAKSAKKKAKDNGLHLTAEIDPSADLSAWSKAVSSASAKGQAAPTLQIVVYAPITKESGNQALAELEKVKGVDVKNSSADVKRGELRIGLNGNDRVTANDISSAVKSAGVEGHFAKMAKSKAS